MKFVQLFVAVVVMVVAVSAYPGGHAESYASFNLKEGHGHHHEEHHHDDDKHHESAPYKFEYGVKDPHTGDNKEAWEHSDGHNVKGQYSLYEADGTKRIVDYHTDKHGGFQAEVKKVGHAHHPITHKHHDDHHDYHH